MPPRIRDCGEHLLTLVNDVLDFAKLGAGKIELHASEVDVEALLRGVCELLSPRAREKGVEIAWAAPADLGAIRADEGRLRQILLNFAGNAVKFTETGGVLVSVVQPRARPPALHRRRHRPRRLRRPSASASSRPSPRPTRRTPTWAARAWAWPSRGAWRWPWTARWASSPAPRAARGFWFEAAFRPRPAPRPAPTLAGRKVGVASPNPIVREAAAPPDRGLRRPARVAAADLRGPAGQDPVRRRDPGGPCPGRRRRALLRRPPERRAIILLAPEERGR